MTTKGIEQAKRSVAAERAALRRRAVRFNRCINEADWEGCYALIDPKLTEQGKVSLGEYAERMQSFKNVYGLVTPWHTRISLHLEAGTQQRDRRPFAYVYMVWQDEAHAFHMFRERWIQDDGQWYTRVVGLVPNRQEAEVG